MFNKFLAALGRFKADKSGVTAIEYGVIAVAIVITILVAIGLLGNEIANTFNDLADAVAP